MSMPGTTSSQVTITWTFTSGESIQITAAAHGYPDAIADAGSQAARRMRDMLEIITSDDDDDDDDEDDAATTVTDG